MIVAGPLGQTFGGQSGFRSVTRAHRGRFSPLTQMQVQPAWLLLLL